MPYKIAIDVRKIRDYGIGTYIRNLVHGLAEIDQENRYLLLVGPAAKESLADLPPNFRTVTVRSPVYSIRELIALSWTLVRLRVDLYHSTHYVLPLWVPSKLVVTIHDIIHLLYPEYLPNRLAFYYAQRMIGRSLQRGDRILAVSANTREDLIDHFHTDRRKIEVVYNGIEDRFRQPLAQEEVAGHLDHLGVEPPYFLFVGNPKPHKNLDRVIQAYARALRRHDFPETLVCVGDPGPAETKIRQRAEQLGIGERIRLLGYVEQEQLPALYQGTSLFIYPTLYEGFGLPIVEAMASGAPVITSNTSALKEIAAGYAHLVNPLDIDGIASAIVQCTTDEEHSRTLAKVGRRRSEEFRWDQAARRTLEIYHEVLGDRSAAIR